MASKVLGVWKEITWQEYGEQVRLIALALDHMGMKIADRVAILAETIPEWLFWDMGILTCGGTSVGIYPTSSSQQVEHVLDDSGSRFVFVEDEEQLDKVLACRENLPDLEKTFVFDLKGLRDFNDPDVMTVDDLLEIGRRQAAENPERWNQLVEGAAPDTIAVLVYTSGTTGLPKGAMLSHDNLLFQIERWGEVIHTFDGDQFLSFLPLCHMAERMMTSLRSLGYGGTVNFAESPETVLENLREIQPTVYLGVPRIWEKLQSIISVAIRDATWFEQTMYRFALQIGYKIADRRLAAEKVPVWLRAVYLPLDLIILRNIRKMIGLSRARFLASGAASISPEVIRWFLALNLRMVELYGLTECSGIATVYRYDQIKLGTVGRPLLDTQLRISPEGEVLISGKHVFKGYHNKPQKTAETIVDGWLHTGDVGSIDNDGYLIISDRMKDIIVTSGGKNITPSEIENKLKFSPFINDAIVVGDGRKFISSLIMIDHDNVAKFAQDYSVPFTNYASLTRAQDVVDLIGKEISKVNRELSNVETIKKFRLLDVQLTVEDEEMTPTLKLKRKLINEKYQDVIAEMYSEVD